MVGRPRDLVRAVGLVGVGRLVTGTIVTGSGPHSDRPSAPRAAADPQSREASPAGHMTAPVTTPVRDPATEGFVAEDRPWKVIVWDDPVNLMHYVTFVFRKLFGFSEKKAERLMMEVHTDGRAVVSSGTKEKAENDVFRLHEHGLWATMEHDS